MAGNGTENVTMSAADTVYSAVWKHDAPVFYCTVQVRALSETRYRWRAIIWCDGYHGYGYTFGVNTSATDITNYVTSATGVAISESNPNGGPIGKYYPSGSPGDDDSGWSSWQTWEGGDLTIYGHCNSGLGNQECTNYESGDAGNSYDSASGTYSYPAFSIKDNIVWYTPPTWDGSAEIINTTGKRITVQAFSWTKGTESVSATVTCYNNSTGEEIDSDTISNGGHKTFTGLENGVRYRFVVEATDGTGNSGGSNRSTVRGRTYACSLSLNSITSCNARITYTSTNGPDDYSTHSGSVTLNGTTITVASSTVSDDYGQWGSLTHNTSYTVTCYMNDLYYYNGNVAYDCTATLTITTYQLALSNTGYTREQHRLITTWQSTVNGSGRSTDAITGNSFTYTSTCSPSNASGSGYIIDGEDGYGGSSRAVTISYPTVTWSNLTMYCQYTITVTVSDGTNTVSTSITLVTLGFYVRIYNGSSWGYYMPYIYDGSWKLAIPYIYNGSQWVEPSGET